MGARILAALASPRRREILRLLRAGECAAGEIHAAMPDVTFGAVSLQLKVLLDAGLVESRAEQRYRVYSVRPDALSPFLPMLEQMWNDALWHLQLAAELEETRRGPRAAPARARRRQRQSSAPRTTRAAARASYPAAGRKKKR